MKLQLSARADLAFEGAAKLSFGSQLLSKITLLTASEL